MCSGEDQEIILTENRLYAFEKIKTDIFNATILHRPVLNNPTRIMADASKEGVGAALQQQGVQPLQPLSFFSKQLHPTEHKYSPFGRELLAIYIAIDHFRYFLEGHIFHILTDHKPLTFALISGRYGYSPREIRQMAFIVEFTADVRNEEG